MSEIVILGCGPSLDLYRPEAHVGAVVFGVNAAAVVFQASCWVAYDHQAFKAYDALVDSAPPNASDVPTPVFSLRRNRHLTSRRAFRPFEDYVKAQPQGSGHMALELAALPGSRPSRVIVYGLDFSEIYDPASPTTPYQYAHCLRDVMKSSLVRAKIAPPPSETRHFGTRFTSWPNYRKQMRAISVLCAGNRIFAAALDCRGLVDLTKIKGAGHDCGWAGAHWEWRNLNAV